MKKTQQENLLEGGARKIAFSYFFSFIPFYFWRGSRCILAIFMRASPGNIQMWIFTQDIARLSPFLINPPEYCKIHRPMLLATKCDIVYLFMRVQNCRRGCKKIINAFVLSRWGSLFANLANYGTHKVLAVFQIILFVNFADCHFCKFCKLICGVWNFISENLSYLHLYFSPFLIFWFASVCSVCPNNQLSTLQ